MSDQPLLEEGRVAPAVQPSASLSAQTDPDAFGASIGDAVVNLGDAAIQIQQHADTAAVVQKMNELHAFDNQQLYDPKAGLLNQEHGTDAPAAADQTFSAYDQKRSELSKDLNDRQKAMFQRSADQHMRIVSRQVFAYEHGQLKRAEGQQYEAAMANAADQAANTYTLPHAPSEPDPLQFQIDKQVALTKDFGAANGWPKEMVDLKVSEAKSRTYMGVIDDMLSKENVTGAQELFQVHGADIQPEQRRQVERALRGVVARTEAEQTSNTILMPSEDGTPVDEATAFQRLNENKELAKDAHKHDAVAKLLIDHFHVQKSAHQEQEAVVHDQILKAFAVDPTTDPRKAVTSLQWSSLDGETQDAVMTHYRQSLVRDSKVQTDPTTWGVLDDLMSDPLRKDEALAVKMIDYVDKLDGTDWKAFKTRQDKIRNGTGDEMLAKDSLINQMAKQTLEANKFLPIKATVQSKADEAAYLRDVKDAIAAEEKDNKGHPLNRDQIQRIMDQRILPVVTKPGLIWDTTQRAFQVIEGQKLPAVVAPDEIKTINAELVNPHTAAFDQRIDTLKQWAKGVDTFGIDRPELRSRARTVMASIIPIQERKFIEAAYIQEHRGQKPTDADILSTWSALQKRRKPVSAPTARELPGDISQAEFNARVDDEQTDPDDL